MLKKIAAAAFAAALAMLLTVSLFPGQAQIVTAYLLRTNNGSDILNTTTFRANLGAAKNGAVTGSGLTMATNRLLGRTTASTGAVEEISVGTGCTLSGGTLACTGAGGTVTSVALSLPSSILTVSGSPVTGSGTLTGSLATQTANTVWAGPTTGSPAAPTFRSLVIADLPTSIPNANLANSAITIAGHSVSLGGSQTLDFSDLTGSLAGSQLPSFSGDCTNSSAALTCTKTNGVAFGYFATGTDATNLTGTINNARLASIPNSALANSAVTIAGHSVSLGGTQTLATTDLTDISKGTWTPAAHGDSTAGSITCATAKGFYHQEGNGAYEAHFELACSGAGTATGNLIVTNVPWTQVNTSSNNGGCWFYIVQQITPNTGHSQITGRINPNSAQIEMLTLGGVGPASQSTADLPISSLGTSWQLDGQCFGQSN